MYFYETNQSILILLETLQYFFSYSRKDSDFVIKLAADLKKAGVNVWVDQLDILPGSRWDDSIETELHNASVVLVVLSETSIRSENVMDEVSFALDKGKRVVPLLIHNCDIPFRLARLQYVNFTEDYTSAFQYLIQTLNVPQNEQTVQVQQSSIADLKYQNKPSQNKDLSSQPQHRKNVLIPVIVVAVIIVASLLFFLNKGNHQEKSLVNLNTADNSKNNEIKNSSDTTALSGNMHNEAGEDYSTAGLSVQDMLKKASDAKLKNDYKGTLYWYTQAESAGDKQARVNLGNIYDAFPGQQSNIDSAIYWYLKAVGNNATGYNTQQGIAYIQQAAAQNKPVCMEFLGHLYMNGFENIPKDDEKAVYWLEKAMNAGNVFAKGFYGIMLYEGRGGLNADHAKGRTLIMQAHKASGNNYWKEVLNNHP